MLNKIKKASIAMAMVVFVLHMVLGFEGALMGSWYGFGMVVVSVIGFVAVMKVSKNEIG